MLKRLIKGGLLAILLCVCSGPLQGAELLPGAVIQGLPATDPLVRSLELYRAGRSEEAVRLLRGLVVTETAVDRQAAALLTLGRIYHDLGQYREALLYLQRIPATKRSPQVQLLEGAVRIAQGEAAMAVPLLKGLEGSGLTPGDERLRLQALADGATRLNQPLQALFFLYRALSQPQLAEPGPLLQQGHALLQRMQEPELAEAAFMFAGSPLGEDARLQLAKGMLARNDPAAARPQLEAVLASGVAFPWREEARQLLSGLSGPQAAVAPRSIAVALPLSGRYGSFGEQVRRGMELALELRPLNPPLQLDIRDTAGDADTAAKLVSTLARSPQILALAGPLTGSEAAAAAVQAQKERLPLLTLSQRDGLAQTGDMVFRNSMTGRLQVEALLRHAMDGQGLRRFAILFPENRSGQEFRDLFTQGVKLRGGAVVASQGYAESETDLRSQIRRLQGLEPNAADPGKVKAKFDALFIPDYADRIGQLVPQLGFYGFEPVQLLGINGWNSPDLVRIGGAAVEGSIFVDGFFRDSPAPAVRSFVERYLQKYGEEPSILAAQGFDILGMLLTALEAPGVRSREELRQALAGLQNYPGVTGTASFDPQGDAVKGLFLLQVRDGQILAYP
jgi:ABC-type branched-subunit amino acid transport system substrate-binding protein